MITPASSRDTFSAPVFRDADDDRPRLECGVFGVYDTDDFFHIVSPVIPGYTADIEVVEGVMGEEDLIFNVIYTPVDYTLTIYYVDISGNQVAPTYQDTLCAGESYSVVSPEVYGMICTDPLVDGVMPAHDVEITVIYLTNTGIEIVDEPETPTPGAGRISINAGDCFE